MQGQKALGFLQKYLNLCSEDEWKSCGFGTAGEWVINDRIFIFGWTIPLRMQSSYLAIMSFPWMYLENFYLFIYLPCRFYRNRLWLWETWSTWACVEDRRAHCQWLHSAASWSLEGTGGSFFHFWSSNGSLCFASCPFLCDSSQTVSFQLGDVETLLTRWFVITGYCAHWCDRRSEWALCSWKQAGPGAEWFQYTPHFNHHRGNASLHEHTHALLCESTALYVTPQAFHHSSVNRKLFTVTSSLEMEIYYIIQFCNSN